MNAQWMATLAAVAVAIAAIFAFLASSRARNGRASPPDAVAASPEAARGRLADLVERLEMLEAEVKGVKRAQTDLEVSWNRRWGTLTRGLRRDRAAEEAEAAETAEAQEDVETLPLPFGAPPVTMPHQPRLVPMRARR